MGKENATGSLEDVLANDGTEEVTIEHNGETFWFEYKTELTWEQKNKITLEHTEIELNEDGEIVGENPDLHEIQKALLKEKIVESSIDEISIMIEGMGDEFADKLIDEILDDDVQDAEGN